MNCDSTRNSVQGLQSVILLINDTSSTSSEHNPNPNHGSEVLRELVEFKGNARMSHVSNSPMMHRKPKMSHNIHHI